MQNSKILKISKRQSSYLSSFSVFSFPFNTSFILSQYSPFLNFQTPFHSFNIRLFSLEMSKNTDNSVYSSIQHDPKAKEFYYQVPNSREKGFKIFSLISIK